MTEPTAAVIVFETFLEQDGPQNAKTGDDGEKFRMSERQRVRGTAVDSWFCEARGNLVSNTVMPPFIQKLLALENPFASFVYFAVRIPRQFSYLSLSTLISSGIELRTRPLQLLQRPRSYTLVSLCYFTTNTGTLE